MTRIVRILVLAVVAGAAAFLPLTAGAAPFSSLFVIGDSLSDTGNNAIVFDSAGVPRTTTPIASPAFIPTPPYASGRYSNGPVWVEGLAAGLGLSAQPSLLGGTNFAFGGARSGPSDPTSFPFSLLDQTQFFLGAMTGGIAPSDALYVVSGGGNDARDAFTDAFWAVLGSSDPSSLIAAYAASYANDIGSIVTDLETAGARHILLVNVPDIGVTPAIQAGKLVFGQWYPDLASSVAAAMNGALNTMLGTLSPAMTDGIRVLDTYTLVDDIIADPAAFGMTDVTSACAASQACIDNPDTTFFWDGIHPTTAGHMILAQAALRTVPEPSTVLLLAMGVFALWISVRRKRRRADATQLQPAEAFA